ncbi:YbfB/YjiJ family MFS transporter [Variovorax fucosicus]|uniref:YbfB/YjiJ family MFS transporter n=1 Tax=Variovorax fucosicus TaxID=3053517 RepID=UPI002575C414|nr:YbfB/YjiJ family MFS transporter [Variovorax sp. J22G47]MDM0058032.1 YbfB/YjiJ family MFS transporter [Variovorax sp. J22G47]
MSNSSNNPASSRPMVGHTSFLAVCAAGALALAIAMGIGRFAFTPMLPLMVREGSLDLASGGWLAAANYAGYLAGAVTAARIALTPQQLGLAALGTIALTTAAMGWTSSVGLWLLLRFVAGVASAWALVSTSVWGLAWLARFERPAGAGMLYAGVGSGIALAGLWCWQAGVAGVRADTLWLQLGALALLLGGAVAVWMPRTSPVSAAAASARAEAGTGRADWSLVICYGVLGFGYILPATFLPVLARAVLDDPAVFGAAWPMFGAAAAISTWLASLLLRGVGRLRVLALCHLLMAVGCLLPVLHLSAGSVLAAALLVGGTFMVATMAGMQEARARVSDNPTAALGRMTAAFAIGQMAGPMLSSLLSTRSANDFTGLFIALAVGALALLASAAWLWRDRPTPSF